MYFVSLAQLIGDFAEIERRKLPKQTNEGISSPQDSYCE